MSHTLRSLLHKLAPLLTLAVFALAAYFVWALLKQHSFEDILRYLTALPRSSVLLAALITAASYFLLTLYDQLAMRYLKHPLSFWKVMMASFTAYSLSNTIGMANIAGSSVRFRMYTGWGLRSGEVLRVVIFCSLSFWLGFLTLAGLILTFHPPLLPEELPLSLGWLQAVGAGCLVFIGAYLSLTLLRQRPFVLKKLHFHLPGFGLSVIQLSVAAADWALAAWVLYLLLPIKDELPFITFLSYFVAAQIVSLISHVPGGVGVLEALMIYLLRSQVPDPSAILAGLIAYRFVYYLAPLCVGAFLLVVYELRKRPRTTAGELIESASHARAHLAWSGDKTILLSRGRGAWLMFAAQGQSWIALGDPIGRKEEFEGLVKSFAARAESRNRYPALYRVTLENAELYRRLGFEMIKMGTELCVDIRVVHDPGEIESEFVFTVLEPQNLEPMWPELAALTEGLQGHYRYERGFSQGIFHPHYLRHFPLCLVHERGRIVAAANLMRSSDREELSVDLIRYHPEADETVLDFLFLQMVRWARSEHFHRFQLGMKPLEASEELRHHQAFVGSRQTQKVLAHGERFYQSAYWRKVEKFATHREPRFLAYPPTVVLPRLLRDLNLAVVKPERAFPFNRQLIVQPL